MGRQSLLIIIVEPNPMKGNADISYINRKKISGNLVRTVLKVLIHVENFKVIFSLKVNQKHITDSCLVANRLLFLGRNLSLDYFPSDVLTAKDHCGHSSALILSQELG